MIKAGADINKPDSAGRTPLIVACERSSLALVKCLTSNGANIDAVESSQQWTPLHIAAYQCDVEIAEWLVMQCQHAVSPLDAAGKCPIHHAAARGCIEIVQLLLNNGEQVCAATL